MIEVAECGGDFEDIVADAVERFVVENDGYIAVFDQVVE